MAAQQHIRPVRFGPYEADLQCGELRKHGRKLRLPAQAIEVLALLLERPGELVTRERLNERLWPNGTIVEFDHGINSCIRRLRAALNDFAAEPRYIETIPKRGYRFVHPCVFVGAPRDRDQEAGQYKIVATLGVGAMGIVYRATDTGLGRDIALKFPADELSREKSVLEAFQREGRAAAALNHPNICTVYGIGEQHGRPFLAMELLEGETLAAILERRGLEVEEMLGIARQVAAALHAAHSKGIIHRDIKPANIFVLPGNLVKVVDFGIAHCPDQVAGQAGTGDQSAGALKGTPRYMAPEQAAGCDADARCDIYAFGVVLYEMIAGKPYESGKETSLSRLRPHLPRELTRLVQYCVAGAPDARPQTAGELMSLLSLASGDMTALPRDTRAFSRRAVAAGAALFALVPVALYLRVSGAPSLDSIAVIPFDNPRLETEYVSDGITEGLINRLAAVPRLKVIARTTAFRFKGQARQPQSVGQQLGVKAVLTGRVWQTGDTVVVQADLVDVNDGSQIWGQKFERKLPDLQSLQSDMVRDITSRLQLDLGHEDQKRLTGRSTEDDEAYRQYLRAIHAAPLRVPAASMNDLLKRKEHLERALTRDPGFALAHVALAETEYALGAARYLPARTAFDNQKQAAERALQLDDALGEAHMHRALAVWNHDWDVRGADKGFRRAIELGTHSASARYALFLIQNGRTHKALAEAAKAMEVDPLSEYTLSVVASTNVYAGKIDQGLEQEQRAVAHSGMPSFLIAYALARKGMYDQALAEFGKLGGYGPAARGHAAHVMARMGRFAEARSTLTELERAAETEGTGAYEVAFVHGALGQKDEAFRWLDRAYEERDPGLTYIKIDHTLDPLRADPRFRELKRQMGLDP